MADAADSKSADLKSCGFKSHQPHQIRELSLFASVLDACVMDKRAGIFYWPVFAILSLPVPKSHASAVSPLTRIIPNNLCILTHLYPSASGTLSCGKPGYR